MRILTYHQVMPSFLDFLFEFGFSEHPKDFHFSGFRYAVWRLRDPKRLALPDIGRTGLEFKMSYTLKSVERAAGSTSRFPWSIRPCAVYHSFDMGANTAFWIIVKANKLMKTRVQNIAERLGFDWDDQFFDIESPFGSTLAVQLLLCVWSGENWRWYINNLEEELQRNTSRTITESMDLSQPPDLLTTTTASTSLEGELGSQRPFSFEHVQEVYFVEEKANEALLVLRSNLNVLTDLLASYDEIYEVIQDSPSGSGEMRSLLREFRKRVEAVQKDNAIHQSRLEVLLRLLGDRKTLVSLDLLCHYTEKIRL